MDKSKSFDEIKRLSKEINEHNYRYYVLSQPSISDGEYDALFKALTQLEAQFPEYILSDSPTQRVGAALVSAARPVRHAVRMISLDNTYSSDEVREWAARVVKGLGYAPAGMTAEFKIDGVSASLVYEKGRLVLAATRGDGETGEEITHNIRACRSVPLVLRMPPGITCPDLLEVRGEIYISRADFQAINEARKNEGEEPFANPRNAASGSLKLLDPAQSSRRGLRFFAHSFGRVEGGPVLTSQSAFLEVARAYGFAVEPHTVCCRDIDEVISACKACEALRPSLPYEVDGVVLKVNDFNAQRQLGETMKSPRWAVAFKFQATQATTRVQDIVVSVGRTGVLTPVAELDPVACGGVMISRATLHNFDEVRRLGIAKGDRVLIERAGDVIPKIIKVVELAAARASVPKVPVDCPACREDFICEEEGAVAYRCINPACPRQLERRLVHFSSRKAMDIEGMGEAVVRQLLEKGLVKSLADVYALRKEDLLVLEFFGDKKADKLLTAIHQSKTRPLSRLMFGLGILNIGEKASLSLAKKFERMEALTAADKTALMGVQDIGEVSASALERFFCQPETRTLIAALAHAGVNMEEPRSSGGALRLSGKVFIFTGHLEKYSREDAETQVRALGAEAGSSVTRSTDFLVAGEAAGSKLDKARKLGVKVINEQQFEELLHDEG